MGGFWRAVRQVASVATVTAITVLVGTPAGARGVATQGGFTVSEIVVSGASDVFAFDVNNQDDVVGGFVDSQGILHGFLYSSGGVIDDVTGDSGFVPHAINERGEMAGTVEVTVDGRRVTHAALRDAPGTVRDLGTLGGPSSVALDVNDAGRVVGYSEIGSEGDDRAFLFDGSQMLQIGPVGSSSSPRVHANSINERGQVVGFDDRGDFGLSEAFLYENGLTTLLPREEEGAQGMFAAAINASGAVAGWADHYYGSLITGSPVRWLSPSATPERLGAYGRAEAINCHGDAVGTHASELGAPQQAALFKDGEVVDLVALVPGDGNADATAISDRGAIVVNRGSPTRAYLLTPTTEEPECPGGSAVTTATLTASADTYLRAGAPDTNEGASPFLRLRASGDNRSLVRFDQAAIASVVGTGTLASATLELRITDNGNNWGPMGRSISAYRLTSAWAEGNGFVDQGRPPTRGSGSGATWACAIDADISDQGKDCSGVTEWEMGKPNQPELHPWKEPATANVLITNGLTGTIRFDVTADVQAFLIGTANNGWILKKDQEGQSGNIEFASRETDFKPQLVLVVGGGSDLALLQRFAPELRYDTQETYRADSAAEITDNYVAGSHSNVLEDGFGNVLAASDPAYTQANLSLNFLAPYYRIGLPAHESHKIDEANSYATDFQRLHALEAYKDRIYGRVKKYANGDKVLQYWFFYYYNPKTYLTRGVHEGDWEMIQILLDANGTPTEATYAQHDDAEACNWNRVSKAADGRPIAYVALDSHASYFGPIVTNKHFDEANGLGEWRVPSVIDVSIEPTWIYWKGRWGSSHSIAFGAESPTGPGRKGQQWDDPRAWGGSLEVDTCTVLAANSRRGDREGRVNLPPVPRIHAHREGQRVVVEYNLPTGPTPEKPWVLLTTVDPAGDRYVPLTRRTKIRKSSGKVVQPIGLGQGPFAVHASVRDSFGYRSKVTTVPLAREP